jgi:hypothetical protein
VTLLLLNSQHLFVHNFFLFCFIWQVKSSYLSSEKRFSLCKEQTHSKNKIDHHGSVVEAPPVFSDSPDFSSRLVKHRIPKCMITHIFSPAGFMPGMHLVRTKLDCANDMTVAVWFMLRQIGWWYDGVALRIVEGLYFSYFGIILISSRELVSDSRMGTAVGPRRHYTCSTCTLSHYFRAAISCVETAPPSSLMFR